MIVINNKYKIVKIDSLNYTYLTYKKVASGREKKDSPYKWIKSRKFFPTMALALLYVKNIMIDEIEKNQDLELKESLAVLDTLINKINNIQED